MVADPVPLPAPLGKLALALGEKLRGRVLALHLASVLADPSFVVASLLAFDGLPMGLGAFGLAASFGVGALADVASFAVGANHETISFTIEIRSPIQRMTGTAIEFPMAL
jgi:hypothetical protein